MAENPPTYIFDTSSLNRIRGLPNANVAWDVVIGLIEEGRGFTVPEAMKELENINPAAHDRLNNHRNVMVLRHSNERFVEAARIRAGYRSMSRANRPFDGADPWVVGVAIADGHTVVTNENPQGRGQKMPKVCDREGVDWVSLEELIERVGP